MRNEKCVTLTYCHFINTTVKKKVTERFNKHVQNALIIHILWTTDKKKK